jgi:outer membrane protein TolC
MKISDAYPTRVRRYQWFTILAVITVSLALTSAPPWGAFAQEPQQAQQQAAAQQQATTTIPEIKLVPVSLEGPVERAEKDGTALRASLRDIIKMALQANLDIAIAETAEDNLQARIQAAKAAYDPNFSSSFSWSDTKSLNFNAYDAAKTSINATLNHSWSATVSQAVPIGGNFSFRLNGSRADTNSSATLANPRYNAGWSLTYTQQLLRDFKIDSNRNGIKVANLNLRNNDTTFKQSVSNIVRDVENAYWGLVQQIESYKIAVASVKQARLTVDTNIKKRDIGVIAPIDVISSQSSQARQEVSLLSAEDSVQRAENSLRTLISKDRSADIWSKTIIPTDVPDVTEFKIDLNTAIATAIKNSPSIESIDNQLEQADLSNQLTLNSRKWSLSLQGSINSTSSGVPEGNKQFPQKLWGGLGTSYLYMFNTQPPSWSFSLSLSLPLSHRANDAALAQNVISKQNLLMNRSKTEQSVVVQVRNAVQGLTTAKKQIDTADIGAQAAQAQLDATQKRVDAGLATNTELIISQDNLNQAKNSLLTAKIGYRTAILNLQQAMFTLLDANNINTGEITKDKKLTFK